MLASAPLLVAGCGGTDDQAATETATAPETIAEIEVETGPFESEEEFVSAVNGFCETAEEIYSRTPVYGISAPGLEAEFETLLTLEREDLAKTESVEAPEGLAEQWAAYNEASSGLNDVHEQVLEAAADGDADGANELLFGESVEALDALTAASEEVGVECVDPAPELSDAEPAAATEAAADAPQPTNTIEEAADEFLAALQSGRCKEIVAASHSQTRVDEDAFADPETGDCSPQAKNLAEGEIAGTVQFGPTGMAVLSANPGEYSYEQFVLDPDQDDALKHVGGLYADSNGLDAPNEGIDADQKAQAFVDAIRADDDQAFNETLTIESLPEEEGGFQQDGPIESIGDDPGFAEAIVEEIRADSEATPELLGVNQVQAAYLVGTAAGNDYVLFATHQPGSETGYGISAYWALPGK